MKKIGFLLLAFGLIFAASVPAEARVFVGVGFGGGYGGYGPRYDYYPGYAYYPGYYPSYYVAPPPQVVYAAPAPSTTYITQSQAPSYITQPPATAPITAAPAASTPGVMTYLDGQGRTCRQYQSAPNAAPTASCQMSDGTWQPAQ